MDNIIADFTAAAASCEQAALPLHEGPLVAEIERLHAATDDVARSWSGSWIGYHATMYAVGFRLPRSGERFDVEWGPGKDPFGNDGRGWQSYTYEEVRREIVRRAAIASTEQLQAAAKAALEAFKQARDELLPLLDALLRTEDDTSLRNVREGVATLPSGLSRDQIVLAKRPGQAITRDQLAMGQWLQGCEAPPHLVFGAWVVALQSRGLQAATLAGLARRAERYLQQRQTLGGGVVERKTGTVFIGHGRSPLWRDLKDLLGERLGLRPDEYNRESAAGLPIAERLQTMVDRASFAFLVMTAEDEHADGTHHARENVIHEVGLFQGRLGFRRAIVLLEQGCAEFSNIHGLGQIRFPSGDLLAVSEEIRRVLEREHILPPEVGDHDRGR